MIIAGLQKLSLVDFPGNVACTVFTGGCNLRCPYCHNSELLDSPPALMSEEDFFHFLSKRKGLLDGVCISGGEPCFSPSEMYGKYGKYGDKNRGCELLKFLGKIREMGFKTKLDTNGCFPSILSDILNAGLLNYVALDVKNSPFDYIKTVGLNSETASPVPLTSDIPGTFGIFKTSAIVKNVLTSIGLLIDYIMTDPDFDFELRTTVVEPLHNAASFIGIRDMIAPLVTKGGSKIPAYYLQSFVDRESVLFSGFHPPSYNTLLSYLNILKAVSDRVEIRGETNST